MKSNCSEARKLYRDGLAANKVSDEFVDEIDLENDQIAMKRRIEKLKESLGKGRSLFKQINPKAGKSNNNSLDARNEAIDERKRRSELNNNSSKATASKKRKVPVRKPRDIEIDEILDEID